MLSTNPELYEIVRIYKNASAEIIGIDELVIAVTDDATATNTFKKAISVSKQTFTLVSEATAGSRVISTVQSIGDYSSITNDSGDWLTATFTILTGNTLDITLTSYVSQIGDTI